MIKQEVYPPFYLNEQAYFSSLNVTFLMRCRESSSAQSCSAPASLSCVLPWGPKTGLMSVDSNHCLPAEPSTWICTAHSLAMTRTSRLHAPMCCMVLYSVSLKRKLFLPLFIFSFSISQYLLCFPPVDLKFVSQSVFQLFLSAFIPAPCAATHTHILFTYSVSHGDKKNVTLPQDFNISLFPLLMIPI